MSWLQRMMLGGGLVAAVLVAAVLVAAVPGGGRLAENQRGGETLPSQPTAEQPVRVAVVGDFGVDNQAEADVAALVASWQPAAVVTTGDNNYPDGAAETLDANVGKYYHSFIYPYQGNYGEGASIHRFFPVLGNHDWYTSAGSPPLPQPYLDYFELPGNERYYEVVVGPIHFFMLDSDPHEPDGIEATSVQAEWLRARLQATQSPWRVVVLHHPPYSSSSRHGSTQPLQWPYAEWGATAVLAGHDHTYERIEREGILYLVNGLGGASLYPLGTPVEGSQRFFAEDHGALLVEATAQTITYTLMTRAGLLQDRFVQQAVDFPLPELPAAVAIEARVSDSADDAEESLSTHLVNLTSSDLELTSDPADPEEVQLVGMRFAGVALPAGSEVLRAYVEFAVDETADTTTTLSFAAQAGDNPLPFQAVDSDLSARARTAAQVSWLSVPPWPTVGWRWRSPDLAPVVQEIVDRPGWQPGQSIVLLVEGSGWRTAESFDGDPSLAPLLHVEIALRSSFPHGLYLPLVSP
jgi:hypothetical protein